VAKLTKKQKAQRLSNAELKTYLEFNPRDPTLRAEAKRRKRR